MKRAKLIVTAQAVALVASLLLAARLPTARFGWLEVACFVAGLTVLKLSDVWLPRGDTLGMSSALALGALFLFDARVVLAMLVAAELVALIPRGRGQIWQAALGALAAEAVSAVVASMLLMSMALHPAIGGLSQASRALHPSEYPFVLAVAVLFAALEFGLLQLEVAIGSKQPLRAALLGSLSFGAWLIAAQASVGVLTALMYRTMGAWGLAVSVVMVLVMRQSFVLLLQIRQAYNATIAVLVKAMEAQTPGREGAAERNAGLCTLLGREMGLHGRELERLRYAALLQGIGDYSESELESTSPVEPRSMGPSRVVAEVEFLRDVVPVLQLCESPRSCVHARRMDWACAYAVMAVGALTGNVNREAMSAVKERLGPRVAGDIDLALARVVRSEKGQRQLCGVDSA